jgi:hypothetical protein
MKYQNENYNVLSIDTQGSELDVLLSSNIEQFNLIIIELNDRIRYENQPIGDKIEEYLVLNKFNKKYVSQHGEHGFSDVIFVK